MVIKVYITTVSANSTLKTNQQHILNILEARNVQFEAVDISAPECESEKMFMREKAKCAEGQTVPMPPQLFSDDEYLGDYNAFYEANEDNALDVFLKLASKTETSQAAVELTTSASQPSAAADQESSEQMANGEADQSESAEDKSEMTADNTETTEQDETNPTYTGNKEDENPDE